MTGEQKLWMGVIIQALRDLREWRSQTTRRMRIEFTALKRWFFGKPDEQDFNAVCALADQKPEIIRECARKVLRK